MLHDPPDPPAVRDFCDVIHGEDLEFRAENNPPLVHLRSGRLGRIPAARFLDSFLESQLVAMAGAASGFVAGVFVCPLDVIKTRFQAQSSSYKYTGFYNAFKTIVRDEGPAALFRGVVPVTIGYLPTWAIYFSVYERAKRFYPQFFTKIMGTNIEFLNHVAASTTAGACCSVLVNPIWVVKTRIMVQTGKEKVFYSGTLDAFRKMYRKEGIRVFYSGLVPSLFGLVHVGIHFPLYEKLKQVLHVDDSDYIARPSNMALWRLLVASAVSKMIASTITYPHEILRTRMQMQSAEERQTLGLANVFRKIYTKQGPRGFYVGYVTNLARAVPASAVTLVSFEYFKTSLLELSGRL